MLTHASIIPLIGGEAIASQQVFGSQPEYIMSYEAFYDNDRHLLERYKNEVPYYVLDHDQFPKKSVDIVSSVCPCAGLSQLSTSFASDNPANEWMIKSTKYVLESVQPKVLWGENAPLFAGNIGKPVRDRLFDIAQDNGYTMTTYRTKSMLHGVPQVRERSFYFFWKGDKTPLLNFYDKELERIEDLIRNVPNMGGDLDVPTNNNIPTENPYYRYILDEIHPGWTHQQFQQSLEKSVNLLDYVEKYVDYATLAKWMEKQGYEKEVKKCMYRYDKINSGGNIMRREIVIPSQYIHAFVGYMPKALVHPDEDRHITYREALAIMGMPNDFELLDPKRNLNHVCQNVPVRTAMDMAYEVKEALSGNREYLDAKNVFQHNHSKKVQIWDAVESSNLEAFLN